MTTAVLHFDAVPWRRQLRAVLRSVISIAAVVPVFSVSVLGAEHRRSTLESMHSARVCGKLHSRHGTERRYLQKSLNILRALQRVIQMLLQKRRCNSQAHAHNQGDR